MRAGSCFVLLTAAPLPVLSTYYTFVDYVGAQTDVSGSFGVVTASL